jgi:hypothetical protein
MGPHIPRDQASSYPDPSDYCLSSDGTILNPTSWASDYDNRGHDIEIQGQRHRQHGADARALALLDQPSDND